MTERKTLTHADCSKKTDEQLAQEAKAHLAKLPELQVVVEFIQVVRRVDLPELKAEKRRETLTAADRMDAFKDRPDLRQAVTTAIAGVPKNAARKMAPDFQASLIDQVVDAEDKTAKEFDEAFAPEDLTVYLDGSFIMSHYWEPFRWEDDDDPHRDVIASFIESLLADREAHITNGIAKQNHPILMPWDVLSAIDPVIEIVLDKLPSDIQVALFRAWHDKERKNRDNPYHAKDWLEIATPRILAKHIPLANLIGVVKLGLERMKFAAPLIWAVEGKPEEKDASPKA
ncbi:MAG: hypothetical protein WC551_00150 [Patescibacteria group bacterium]